MKNYFVLFYFNFNIIITFYFHYNHDCCFNIKNGTNNAQMYDQTCYLSEHEGRSSNYEGKIGENYYIKNRYDHGSYISGYIDFGNNCRIKISTNNLISIYNLEPTDSIVNIDNNNFEKLNIKVKNNWKISFNIYKFPSSCNGDVFISIKTKDLIIFVYNNFPSILIKNLFDCSENNYINNYIKFNFNSNNVQLFNGLNQQIIQKIFISEIDFEFLKIIFNEENNEDSSKKYQIEFYVVNDNDYPISTLSTITINLCENNCCISNEYSYLNNDNTYCVNKLEYENNDDYIYYADNNTFISCDSICKCDENFYHIISNKTCIENCPSELYIYEKNSSCLNNCNNLYQLDNINECVDYSFLNNDKTYCVNKLEYAIKNEYIYYADNNTFISCDSNCECIGDFYYIINNNTCIKNCPSELYIYEKNSSCLNNCNNLYQLDNINECVG